jgi:hypothetical protein
MKRAIPVLFAMTITLWGQSERRTHVFDWEGRRVPWTSSSASNGSSSESVENMNGRTAPLEQVEERILNESGGVKTVEKTIKRFDSNGSPLPPERVVTETTDLGGGRQTTTTTVYRGDLNGRLTLAERTVARTNPTGESGAVVTTQTDRPTLNGALETVEKKEARLTTSGDKSERDETRYLPDGNGRFVEAARVVERSSKAGGKTVVQKDELEAAPTGKLALTRQVVATTTTSGSGEVTVSDVYGAAAPGRPVTGQLQLRERQILEKNFDANGAKETLSIQRPGVDDSGRLGEARKIFETVCTGKCGQAKP